MSRGLGPWQDSYGVGEKGPPPLNHYELRRQQDAFNQAMQGQAMSNYTQLAQMQAQPVYGGSLGMFGGDPVPVIRREFDGWEYGPPKPVYKFMQRTKGGRMVRSILEVLFWISLSVFLAGWFVLPIVIKLGTVLWTWALS